MTAAFDGLLACWSTSSGGTRAIGPPLWKAYTAPIEAAQKLGGRASYFHESQI